MTLVLGPTGLTAPSSIDVLPVQTAQEMSRAVQKRLPRTDVFIAAAAVGDWRFEKISRHKIKKGRSKKMKVSLVRNPDILAEAGRWKARKKNELVLIGFALETKNVEQAALQKLKEKNLDLIVANTPATFSSSIIRPTFIDKSWRAQRFAPMAKAKFSKVLAGWIKKNTSKV